MPEPLKHQASAIGKYKGDGGVLSCLRIPVSGNEVVKCEGVGGWLCRFTDLLWIECLPVGRYGKPKY